MAEYITDFYCKKHSCSYVLDGTVFYGNYEAPHYVCPSCKKEREDELDNKLARAKAIKEEAISAIAKKFDCSIEAATLLYKNKAY